MSRGFKPGDPRAVAAGRKGGQGNARYWELKGKARGPEWNRGYQAGWRARDREIKRGLNDADVHLPR